MPLNPADKKFDLDLEKRVKKLEAHIESLENHMDKKLKSKKKKFPEKFSEEKAARHETHKSMWATHEDEFNRVRAGYPDGRLPAEEYADLLNARRALRKEGRKYRLHKEEEALGPDELDDARRAERDMRKAEVFKPPTGGFSGGDEGSGFTGAARYGVRPPARASALGASAGGGLRYGRRI